MAAMLSIFSSCDKLLDSKPDSSLTRQEFFKTEADANSALVGVYDALQGCVNQFWLWGESRGDLVVSGTNPYLQLFTSVDDISKWQVAYLLIGRANVVITDVPPITKSDKNFSEAESNSVVGQARFLRALAYFYLVRTFNQVPLVLDAPNSDDVHYTPAKASADEILNQIEADLAFAEPNVPIEYARERDLRGLVTKAAVNALQADVYLWRAKYSEAAEAAKKVIDNTRLYSLVQSEDWFNVFSVKNSRESIFEVQFDYTLNENNNLKNVAGAYSVNRTLIGYFDSEQDVVRGKDHTYINGNMFWKYRGLSAQNAVERPTNDPNFILYRLPDVMLMRAEALAHTDDFSAKEEAVHLINQVRERALLGLIDLDGNTATNVLVDLIMKERAMELGMEGKRWFDLVRVAKNDNRPEFLVDLIVMSRSVGERATIRPRVIDPRSWYLPIHRDELAANPNLVQNPYYPQ